MWAWWKRSVWLVRGERRGWCQGGGGMGGGGASRVRTVMCCSSRHDHLDGADQTWAHTQNRSGAQAAAGMQSEALCPATRVSLLCETDLR